MRIMARGTILLIDDEIDIRGFLKDFFEDRDFNVETASDGAEGVEKFKKGKFDLVVSDMLMPKLIGLEVLRQIRAAKPDQRVIMMTGVKEESMMAKAKELGCHDYLTKPVQLAQLVEKITECFPE
ncbi:MAG: response regulator [Candidatus Omnitrophica bacterium]|nr:response regulator [Candidatus Omnitrophota bacterium]